jgi:hypothetical protein
LKRFFTIIKLIKGKLQNEYGAKMEKDKVIVVDLDGTLLLKSSLTIIWAISTQMTRCLFVIKSIFSRADAKEYLSRKALLNKIHSTKMDLLYQKHFNLKLLNYLAQQKHNGYKIVLATGASHLLLPLIEQAISTKLSQMHNKMNIIDKHNNKEAYFEERLQFFDYIISSTKNCNTIGKTKLTAILEYIAIHNTSSTKLKTSTYNSQFTYIGNSYQDIVIWNAASEIGFVKNNNSIFGKIFSWYVQKVYQHKLHSYSMHYDK